MTVHKTSFSFLQKGTLSAIESAEASEYWDDDSNQSRVEEWTHRYEMMDFAMQSWEEGCDYAINNWTDLDQHEFMEIEQ